MRAVALLAVLLLCGCAGGPPSDEWWVEHHRTDVLIKHRRGRTAQQKAALLAALDTYASMPGAAAKYRWRIEQHAQDHDPDVRWHAGIALWAMNTGWHYDIDKNSDGQFYAIPTDMKTPPVTTEMPVTIMGPVTTSH